MGYSVVVSLIDDDAEEEIAQCAMKETEDREAAIAAFEKLAGASFEECALDQEDEDDDDEEDDDAA
jgi:hypothetical protein